MRSPGSLLQQLNASTGLPLTMYTLISFVMYRLMGPPILVLIVPFGLAYAYWFAFLRHRSVAFTHRFMGLYLAMYVMQFLHLIEEWNAGFYNAFPALWGAFWFGDPARFSPWGMHVFITGNLLMDALWAVALGLFASRTAWANYTLHLFLAGMIVNAVGHPLYSLYLITHPDLQVYLSKVYGMTSTWYFPGLFTATGHAVFSSLMVGELMRQYRGSAA